MTKKAAAGAKGKAGGGKQERDIEAVIDDAIGAGHVELADDLARDFLEMIFRLADEPDETSRANYATDIAVAVFNMTVARARSETAFINSVPRMKGAIR